MAELFYRDKSKLFECKISVEGGSLWNSKSRLRLEFDDISYTFQGKIQEDGTCKVKIPALKSAPSDNGVVTLEVISEETFFEPWTSDFDVKRAKNVTVEVISNETEETKPRITVKKKEMGIFNENADKVSVKLAKEIINTYDSMDEDKQQSLKTIVKEHKASRATKRDAERIFVNPNSYTSKLYSYFIDMAK
jgi:hypothetical protein